jgi:hypothetical protein
MLFFFSFSFEVMLEFGPRRRLLGKHSITWTMTSTSPFVCGTMVWTQGLHLETLHQPFFVMNFFKITSVNYLPKLNFNSDPLDLCLLNSEDYRSEQPAPGYFQPCLILMLFPKAGLGPWYSYLYLPIVLFFWDRVLLTFFSDWPPTVIFLSPPPKKLGLYVWVTMPGLLGSCYHVLD